MQTTKKNPSVLALSLLIGLGIILAFTGVYLVDGVPSHETAGSEAYHSSDGNELITLSAGSGIGGAAFLMNMQPQDEFSPVAPAAETGATVGDIMRWSGVVAIIAALLILLVIEFFQKNKINRMNYRLLLIICLFVLPLLVGMSASVTLLETTKTVESCASCHVMDPFVNDLFHQESTSLAARHYKNGWIAETQCYTCHTTYGAHGTFEGKRDGFRHWLLFVTQTWEDPITYAGSYPNINCTACHGGTTAFREVPSHQGLSHKLQTDQVSCTSCHGPAHPTPAEREHVPERGAPTAATVPELETITRWVEAKDGNNQ